jgi:phosphate:Na+ symporter
VEKMQELIFGLLGGLALFLYGMDLMGEGLQKAAGNRMRRILEVLTGIPIIGVLVGALVTSIIQSSSATTVMTVGFVNAGLLTLKQAISVIMGANIGTTMTAQLIAFKLTKYILPIIALGFVFYFFSKKKSHKYFGQVILGFGILMFGMELMGDAMSPLEHFQGFKDFMTQFSNYPLMGVGVGIVMTMLIQSSSATIGILIALASSGLIPLEGAIPILLGDNIGTCITAVLASIGTNLAAKRTAIGHVFFNVFGSIIFITFLGFFIKFVHLISPVNDIARQIANAHTSFNVLNTIIFLPLINQFVNLILKLVPGEEKVITKGPIYLDNRTLASPTIALQLASKEIIRMAEMALQNVRDAMNCLFSKEDKDLKNVFDYEPVIDELEEDITAYLVRVSQEGLNPESSKFHTGLLHAANDIERIGDHAENIANITKQYIDAGLSFSEQAVDEMKTLYDLVEQSYSKTIKALQKDDQQLAREAMLIINKASQLEKQLRNSHIERLTAGTCIPASGVLFLDVLSNLKRVSDHAHNIAQVVLGEV